MRAGATFLNGLFVFGYFVLADSLAPKLVSAGQVWLWSLILTGYVGGMYLVNRMLPSGRGKRGAAIRLLEATAYILLLLTLFLSDSSLRPVLERRGLDGLWLPSTLLFAVVVATIAWKSHVRRKRSDGSTN